MKINKLLNLDEKKTVLLMIKLYCKNHHGTTYGNLCSQCSELFDYSLKRIEHCPLNPSKPPCSECTIHCYKPELREFIQSVMRYSGPRMIFIHPIIAIKYLIYKKLKKINTNISDKDLN